jgi:hypothetical protein
MKETAPPTLIIFSSNYGISALHLQFLNNPSVINIGNSIDFGPLTFRTDALPIRLSYILSNSTFLKEFDVNKH